LFSWLCHRYEDLSTILQITDDMSCVYSTHVLFHLTMEDNDPLYAKLLDDGYKFSPIESLRKVYRKTNEHSKKILPSILEQLGSRAFLH
jgi:hypothetical protein